MASISNLEKAYKFSVRDMTPLEIANDPQLDLGPLVIEHDFRTITIPSGRQLLGVTSDENVNIVPFVCPRYYGPTDLSEYDFRVNYENANGEGDAYAVQDLEVHDDDTLTFTWMVGRHACEYAGNVHFIVCARIADSGGIISNEYNTAVHTLPVVQGLETDAQIAEDNYDLIEEFLQNLDAAAAIPQQAEDVAENTLKVEGMTYGTQDGEPVDSSSEYYHNNSVYYNGLVAGAGANALKAEGFAVGEQNGSAVQSGSPYYHNNAEYFAGQASGSADLAASKASEVADKVLVSDTEPSASGNLVWVKSTPGTVQVPTYAEFSDVKSAFTYNESKNFEVVATTWELGTASSSDGSLNPSTNNIRTNKIVCESGTKVVAKDGFVVMVFKYNATTGAYIGTMGSWASEYTTDNKYSILVLAKYSNSATISNVSDVSNNISIAYHYPSYVDEIFNTAFFKRTLLTNSDDLNNITEIGTYAYATASIPTNAPLAIGSLLNVFEIDGELSQIVYTTQGSSYVRYRGASGTWTTAWKRNGENILTPDDFTGSDADKIQAALDSLALTGGTILLTREYTLTKNIRNTLDTNSNIKIMLLGIGKEAKINCGAYSITGSTPGRSGGLWFDNVTFSGSANAFDCSALIRLHFVNCYFSGFVNVFYGGNERSESKILQSIYVDMCIFRNITGAVFFNAYNAVFDVHVTNSTIEASKDFFKSTGHDYIAFLYVCNNCIEGLTGSVFIASPNQAIDQCVFNGNHMEQNNTYFDLSSMLFAANMSICDNFVGDNNEVAFINLPSTVLLSNGYLTVERNTLADKTAQGYVFGLPNGASYGNYKGLRYKDNRFGYLTDGNAYNNILPYNGTEQLTFSGTEFADFVENALAYLAVAQSKFCEVYSVIWQSNGYYTFHVTQYESGKASAFIYNINKAVIAQYTTAATNIKEITLT